MFIFTQQIEYLNEKSTKVSASFCNFQLKHYQKLYDITYLNSEK